MKRNPILIIFGSYFTEFFNEITYINMGDLGIIVSIAYYGLILVIPAIYYLIIKIFIKAKSKEKDNQYSKVIIACTLGAIPIWIFNFEFLYFLPTNYIILYGLFLSESIKIKDNNIKNNF